MESLGTPQAQADRRRRDRQFQVRLPGLLSQKVRAFMHNNKLNQNQALIHIIESFFNSSCSTSTQSETLEKTQKESN